MAHKPAYEELQLEPEEELGKYRIHLEDLVGQRTAELAEANTQLKREIAERKRVEEALRQSEEKYRTISSAAQDAIVMMDNKGIISYWNPAAERIFGYSTEETIGKELHTLLGPERYQEAYKKGFKKFQKTGQGLAVGKTLELSAMRKKGTEFPMELSISGIKIKGKWHATGIIRDITDRKQAEEEKRKLQTQLQQAHRMEAIGTLAGGIAHDFNNLLMGIQGNVSLMLMDMSSTHPHYERLRNIERQVQSGAQLTSHLLGYARKGRYEVKPIDLNKVVKEASETFGRTKKEISIHYELAKDLFAIEADLGQIEQVLLNLFVNAADAMPGGGDIILKTMNTTHKEMKGKLHHPEPGGYVLLMVSDTGMGMDKKTMERIFDPFFTTKDMGRGTGLGLASAYGIIKGHGGYIYVDSEIGHGTTFSIYLPASKKKVRRDAKIAKRLIKRTGTVLLVDDEEVILEVGQELLEAMGYQVLLARDGKEAIEVYRKNRDSIDIVLLDMVMPNMGGGKAYDRLKEIDPDIKVLLSSGYSIDGEATEILERGCNGFIQKPFNMMGLSGKIEEVLEKE